MVEQLLGFRAHLCWQLVWFPTRPSCRPQKDSAPQRKELHSSESPSLSPRLAPIKGNSQPWLSVAVVMEIVIRTGLRGPEVRVQLLWLAAHVSWMLESELIK